MLAVKGKALGRKTLFELTTVVTPDTILSEDLKVGGVLCPYEAASSPAFLLIQRPARIMVMDR